MALTRVQIAGQIRSELGVTQTELPNDLLYSYLNLVQKEVVQMLGPVVEPLFRKRATLAAAACDGKVNSGTGTYSVATDIIDGFSGLTADAHIGQEVVFLATIAAVADAYIDTITDNGVTNITIAGNCGIPGSATAVLAFIIQEPTETDPATVAYNLPADCMRPIYLSDNTTPSSESRIDVIQVDDTEVYLENTYWGSEVRAAVQTGDVLRILKGSSATYPATVVLTYVKRPADFANNTDELLISASRLPEEYFGILRAGILKLAAQHLKRKEEMDLAGEDMNQRISAIQQAWGMSQMVEREEESTRM